MHRTNVAVGLSVARTAPAAGPCGLLAFATSTEFWPALRFRVGTDHSRRFEYGLRFNLGW